MTAPVRSLTTRRPAGVAFIAVLAWIGAILQIGSGVLILTGVVSPRVVSPEAAWIGIVVGAFAIVVAVCLFDGSRLARILVTISFALTIASSAIGLIAHSTDLVAGLLTAIVALVGVAMLYTRRANEYFTR